MQEENLGSQSITGEKVQSTYEGTSGGPHVPTGNPGEPSASTGSPIPKPNPGEKIQGRTKIKWEKWENEDSTSVYIMK